MSDGLLFDQFGHIDIYLFDQLLRGRISPGMRVMDAGCGTGRNLVYLLRDGYDVYATDQDPQAVDAVRTLATTLAPHLPAPFSALRRSYHGRRAMSRPGLSRSPSRCAMRPVPVPAGVSASP